MPRVKGGTVTRKRRKKVLKLAKGYFGSKHTLYKVANQQVMKSGNYAFRDRRQKKRDFRKLWITRINAAARMNGLSYSRLMHGLKLAFNSKRTSQKLYHHEPVDGAGLYGDFDVWNAVCRFRENLCFGIYNAYICYGDQPFFIKRENECV